MDATFFYDAMHPVPKPSRNPAKIPSGRSRSIASAASCSFASVRSARKTLVWIGIRRS